MSDLHPRDSDSEGRVDSSSFGIQEDGQAPLNFKEEELNMNLDDTGAEEPSIVEQLELSMEDHDVDSNLKLEVKHKTESTEIGLKMDEDYNEPSLNDESVKHEGAEHILKHEDSESRLKIESFHEIKSAEEAEEAEEPSTFEQDDKDIVGLFEDSDENETSDSKSKLSPTLTSQYQFHQTLEHDNMNDFQVKQSEKFEERTVINTTLTLVPKPQDAERLAICRFPPTLKVVSHSEVRNFLRANPQLLERPPNTNTLSILCFRRTPSCDNSNNQAPSPEPGDISTDSDLNRKNTDSIHAGSETVAANTPNSTPTQESAATPRTSDLDRVNLQKRIIENLIASDNKRKLETSTWESNGKMVVWEDGNVSMFVGKVPLDCESVNEMSFLLEDERADIKPVHAQVDTRLQTRFSNLHTRFSTFKNDPLKKKEHKRQKMEVTSLSDAIQSHHALQQNLLHVRENERQKKFTHSSKGLTRSFLESSDSDDEL